MHSKAPWTFELLKDTDNELINSGDEIIAEVIAEGCTPEEFEANCNLIVTAPQLLEAADEVIATWGKGALAAAVRKLDAAIAKARGRQCMHCHGTGLHPLSRGDEKMPCVHCNATGSRL